VKLFLHELRYELLLYVRSRELAFFTFMFPIILFLLLGSVYGENDEINGYRGADYLLTGVIGYGVAATAFGGLAIILVIRRETGVLKRLRATPLPAAAYVSAVLATTLIFFLVEAIALVAIGMSLFDVDFPKNLFSLILALLLGGGAFAALGVGMACVIRRAEGASAVINAIYLPVSFLSGTFFSQRAFPEFLQKIADVLPLTYFIDLIGVVMLEGSSIWDQPTDVAVIAGWGAAGAIVALRYFRWVPQEG
jgi:ABC-2 type transport system permease protein